MNDRSIETSAWILLSILLAAGCGAGAAEPSAAPPTSGGESRADVPDDFAIRVESAPVAAQMARGMTMRLTRIEPRRGAPGAFDLVTVEHERGTFGPSASDREVARRPVPSDRVAALAALVRDRRAELEAPCIDEDVSDGATTSIRVHVSGVDHAFVCTNATTPAFAELRDAFTALVREID